MSRHAAPRTGARRATRAAQPRMPRWRFGQGRTRALVSLGALLLLGTTGTMAFWTDEAMIITSPIQSGTLDLTAGPTTGTENLTGTGPNSWTYSAFAISDLVPAESLSRTVVIRNSGSAAFNFNATITSSTNNLTSGGQGLLVQVYDNSTAATPTGSQANGNRAGLCTGGTQVYSQYVSTTSTSSIYSTPFTLATNGSTRNLCVRAQLDSAAPNALQGKSTAINLALTATQVASP